MSDFSKAVKKVSKTVKKVSKNPLSGLIAPTIFAPGLIRDAITGKPKAATPENMTNKEAQFAAAIEELRRAAPEDQARIMKEVEEQKRLGAGYAGESSSKRAAMLTKLSDLLVSQQNRQLKDQIPELAEQANLKGIFRSTGLGNSIGREASKLAAQTSDELARQSLYNTEQDITDMQGVNQDYLRGRYSGLERSFSLEDMARQGLIAKTTGQLVQPAPVKTPSAKGSGALQGALGGAGIGASVGGPYGAAAGGLIGAVGGGKLGSK